MGHTFIFWKWNNWARFVGLMLAVWKTVLVSNHSSKKGSAIFCCRLFFTLTMMLLHFNGQYRPIFSDLLCKLGFPFSLIFHTIFATCGGSGCNILGGIKYLKIFRNFLKFCHTWAGSSQVGDVCTPLGPCSTSGSLSLWCSQQDFLKAMFLRITG